MEGSRRRDAQPSSTLSARRSKTSVILIILVVVTVLAVVGLQVIDVRSPYFKPTQSGMPKIPMEQITFIRDPLYSGPPSNETNAAWQNLAPSGRGFVVLDDPEEYGLKDKPGVLNHGVRNKYGLSVFHQLHCLAMLREAYYSAINHEQAHIWGEDELGDEHRDHARVEHVAHCFDYLRQSLMCAGDTTIEWARTDGEGNLAGDVDGWGITHGQCRSWDAIYGWTSEHAAEDASHAGIA